jgi:thiosulfate reductase cytochrome b subunit
MKRLHLYTRFERLWHWTQALLIIGLGLTGFNMHGSWHLTTFEQAHWWHVRLAWALVGLTAFAIFWHFTTGTWKQYIPTTERLNAITHYYLVGIFRNEKHPFKKNEVSKLNPLQRLTYLGFKILIAPVMILTGLLMIYYHQWPMWGLNWSFGTVALLHTAGAFLLLMFFIVHVYMTTTGHTVFSHIKAMITGYEELPEEEVAAAD